MPEEALFSRLKAERDAAMQLAEQAEQRLLDFQQEAEEHLAEGYDEAYKCLQKEKEAGYKLSQEKRDLEQKLAHLQEQHNRLLKAHDTEQTYANMVDAEFKVKEANLYQEFEEKLKEQRDFAIGKLDEYLKMKLEMAEEDMVISEIEKMMAKGGAALVEEALGEAGVELQKQIAAEKEQQEAQAKKKEESRRAEAQKIREQFEKQKEKDKLIQLRRLAKQLLDKKNDPKIAENYRPVRKTTIGCDSPITEDLAQKYIDDDLVRPLEDRVKELADKKEAGENSPPLPKRRYR